MATTTTTSTTPTTTAPTPLTVIQPQPITTGGAQDCAACPNLERCWKPRGRKTLSEEAILTNLLVCRVQRNIDRNRSMRLLLKILSPLIRKAARSVARQTNAPIADTIHEVESVVAESILKFDLGGDAPPIVWLFNPRYGSVRHWILQTLTRNERDRTLFYSYDSTEVGRHHDLEERLRMLNQLATRNRVRSWSWPWPATDVDADADVDERHMRALEVVDDGHTLTTTEYRVLKFCLRHAHGAVRLTDWLHQHLADVMDVPRKDISRVYGLAWRKLIEAVGLREQYFRARGCTLRRQYRRGAISAEDIHEALSLLGRVTVLDVAWLLGVTDTTVHTLRRKYGGRSVEEIHALMRRRRTTTP